MKRRIESYDNETLLIIYKTKIKFESVEGNPGYMTFTLYEIEDEILRRMACSDSSDPDFVKSMNGL